MKKILHIGCGQTKIPGAIGLDIVKLDTVDIVHDLNVFPYPFENNSFDEIIMYHVLEHLNEPIRVMEELNRILGIDGKLFIRVPHFSSLGAFTDITHKRPFGYESFSCFAEENPLSFYTKKRFQIMERQIRYLGNVPTVGPYQEYLFHKTISPIVSPVIISLNWLINLSPSFFERVWCYWIGGALEVYIVLKK